MAANTIMMYFRIPAASLDSVETWEKLQGMGAVSLGKLQADPTVLALGGSYNRLIVFEGSDGSHATLRIYQNGLATLDIQQFVADTEHNKCSRNKHNIAGMKVNYVFAVSNTKAQLSEEYICTLEQRLRNHLGDLCQESESLHCPVRRGQQAWPYTITADERIVEIDAEAILFEKDSQWQNIRIVHNPRFGSSLYLDGDVMISESDLVYTTTLLRIGHEDYRGKEILILGGGDGGILHELLKENPAFVLMAEIDEDVILACRTHMRSVCGDSMDVFEGANYKILIDDCKRVLDDCIQSGRLFDYVVNDLTEMPVNKEANGYNYDFKKTSSLTAMSLKALKPGGKLLSRGNCVSAVDFQTNLVNDIQKLGCDFRRHDVFVPSFSEVYSLYEIWKKEENGIKIDEKKTVV